MPTSLTLGSFTPSVLLRVARGTGALADAGLEVTETPVPSSPGQFSALLDGSLDAVLTSPDNVLAYRYSPTQPARAHRRRPDRVRRGPRARPRRCTPRRRARRRRHCAARTFGVDVPRLRLRLRDVRAGRVGRLGRDDYEVVALGSTPKRLQALLRGECAATMLNAGNELHAEAAGYRALADGRAEVCAPYLGTVLAVVGERTAGAGRPAGRRAGPDRGRRSSPAGSTTEPSAEAAGRARAAGAAGPALPRPAARTRTRGWCRTAWSTRPRSGRSCGCGAATGRRPTAGPTCSPRRWRRDRACWSRPDGSTDRPADDRTRPLLAAAAAADLVRQHARPVRHAVGAAGDLPRPGAFRCRRWSPRRASTTSRTGRCSRSGGSSPTGSAGSARCGSRCCWRRSRPRRRPACTTSLGLIVARGIAGGAVRRGDADLPDLRRRHGADPAPAAGGDPAAGRRRARHRARRGRRRRAGPARQLAAGVRDHRRAARSCWPCCCAGCPSRAAGHGNACSPRCEQVVARRSRCWCCCCRSLEGVVLLGTLTLLPAAVESAGTGAAVAGAVTAAYGLAVLAFAPMVGRLSRHWPTWRLIGIGGAAAVAGCLTAALSQQAAGGHGRGRAARARLGRDALVAADLGDQRAARRPGGDGLAVRRGAVRRQRARLGSGGRPGRRRRVQRDLRLARGAGRAARVAGDRRPGPMATAGRPGRRWRTRFRIGQIRMLRVPAPTLRDVAQLAGVHPATASRALNPQTRPLVNADTARKVLRAAESLGYQPNPIARSLKTARTRPSGWSSRTSPTRCSRRSCAASRTCWPPPDTAP